MSNNFRVTEIKRQDLMLHHLNRNKKRRKKKSLPCSCLCSAVYKIHTYPLNCVSRFWAFADFAFIEFFGPNGVYRMSYGSVFQTSTTTLWLLLCLLALWVIIFWTDLHFYIFFISPSHRRGKKASNLHKTRMGQDNNVFFIGYFPLLNIPYVPFLPFKS